MSAGKAAKLPDRKSRTVRTGKAEKNGRESQDRPDGKGRKNGRESQDSPDRKGRKNGQESQKSLKYAREKMVVYFYINKRRKQV